MLRTIGRYALLTFLAVVVLFPIYITVVNSLLTPQQIGKQPPTLLPDASRSSAPTATRGAPGISAAT